nr:MAG TPA: hypothetical protein [Caudoviricetes sp.]
MVHLDLSIGLLIDKPFVFLLSFRPPAESSVSI